jgi:hypothetical protein
VVAAEAAMVILALLVEMAPQELMLTVVVITEVGPKADLVV